MKKTKILSALALASCVMLSGCNKKEEPTVDPSLVVADLPHLVAGQEFDISSYVTAQGGSGAVTLTLDAASEGWATLDSTGTKITAAHSGELKFTVHYGDLKADVSVPVDSQEFVEFAEATKDPVYRYQVSSYDLEDDERYVSSIEFYHESYYLCYDETGFNGFTEIEDKVYTFSLDVDIEEEEFELGDIIISGNEPASLDSVCVSFPLVGASGKSKFVPAEKDSLHVNPVDYECISYTLKKTVYGVTESLLGYSTEAMEHYSYIPKEIQVLPGLEEFEDGSTQRYFEVVLFVQVPESIIDPTASPTSKVVVPFTTVDVVLGDESIWFPGLEELFPAEAPTGVDASDLLDEFAQDVSGHNFTVEYSFNWYKEVNDELVALDYNPFREGATADYIHDFLNAIGGLSAYVTENQTYVKYQIGEESEEIGLVNHGGNAYRYAPKKEVSGYEATLLGPNLDIYNDAFRTIPYNYLFLSQINDTYFNYKLAEKCYEFSYGSASDFIYNLLVSAVPYVIEWKSYSDLGGDVDAFIDEHADITNLIWLFDEYDYLAGCECTFAKVNDSYNLEIVWEDEFTEADKSTSDVFYKIDISFKNFGTTEIPGGIVIDYPTAE